MLSGRLKPGSKRTRGSRTSQAIALNGSAFVFITLGIWLFLQFPVLSAGGAEPKAADQRLIDAGEAPVSLALAPRPSKEDLQSQLKVISPGETFALAYRFQKDKDYQHAKTLFTTLLGKYPVLEDYVLHFLAQAEVAREKYGAAISHWQKLLKFYPQSRFAVEAQLEMANIYEKQGKFEPALDIYGQLYPYKLSKEQQLSALGHKARCEEGMEAFSQAMETYRKLIVRHPNSPEALQGLVRSRILTRKLGLPPIKLTEKEAWEQIRKLIAVHEYETARMKLGKFRERFPGSSKIIPSYLKQAWCARRSGRTHSAVVYYRKLIASYPTSNEAVEARYCLARILWNRNRDEHAIELLNQIIQGDASRRWKAKSLYILARIHEEAENWTDAIAAYHELTRNYSHRKLLGQSWWRLGWIRYIQGDYKQAEKAFDWAADTAPGATLCASSLYWQARAEEGLGKSDSNISGGRTPELEAITGTLLLRFPYSYYTQLVKARWGGSATPGIAPLAGTTVETATLRTSKPDRLPVSLKADPFKIILQLAPESKFHLEKTRELAALKLLEEAKCELDLLTPPGNLHLRRMEFYYHLSQLYQSVGGHEKSLRLARQLLGVAGSQRYEVPDELLQLCYPLNYWGKIKDYATRNKLDPYLVLAVIRQESVFDPKALSPANARGLMQIIPPTAVKIGGHLGLTNLKPEQLYDPEINLALGTHYLAQLLEEFQGDVVLSLAAYNAGEKAANIWKKKLAGKPREIFIEELPYPETKEYIKHVLGNYRNYVGLYRGWR